MKRHLLRQISNEWRTNFWLVIELVIVMLVISGISLSFFHMISTRMVKGGTDPENVYFGSIQEIDPTSRAYDSNHTDNPYDDIALIVKNFESKPGVEAVGTGTNALPYNFNSWTFGLVNIEGQDTVIYGSNIRFMSPEMIKVLQIKGENGETPEQLAGILKPGRIFLSRFKEYDGKEYGDELLGREMIKMHDSTVRVKVTNIIPAIKRNDYEPLFSGTTIWHIDQRLNGNERISPNTVALRVKDGSRKVFEESLKSSDFRMGNIRITNFKYLPDEREKVHRNYEINMRNMFTIMAFLLMVVFMGFIGTFRFRTQERRGEIAIRKVNGARDGDIFRRFISEGLILLSFAAIICTPVIYLLKDTEVITNMSLYSRFSVWDAFAATIAVMALIIIAGIWWPASRAVRQPAAEALHNE